MFDSTVKTLALGIVLCSQHIILVLHVFSFVDDVNVLSMQKNDDPELTAALQLLHALPFAIAMLRGAGVLDLCSRAVFPLLV